ncbi:hypothetical protein [Rickettsiella massiliensis]|uniref:hypothetical protein n=1 Tax=Rickettsiella massiliensis TaxID=676517 RepID=UPI00029AB637|nr:hypothetical protein [Rickettsiella massiliensis]
MCRRLFPAIVIGLAVLMAIAASVAKQDYVDYIVVISRFFDIMLPVLAVGALIKYLSGSSLKKEGGCGCKHSKQDQD